MEFSLYIFFILVTMTSLTSSNPISTINSPDGDIIDCINLLDQLSLKNSLLRNHDLQEYPTGMQKIENELEQTWQVWNEKGITCPKGTIPTRRSVLSHHKDEFQTKSHPETYRVRNPTIDHEYAIVYKKNRDKIYGTRATINVWDPIVESPDDFSLAQIWLASGSYENSDINTIEAGWQIFPERYLDNQPRLFTYWTRDAYNTTGCYSTHCVGFVHTSNRIALEAAISRTSTFNGTQLDITIQIWKDHISGNWWLGLGKNVEPVGYWPAAIFTLLSDHATMVHWGGEVMYKNSSGQNMVVHMGSGEYANKGFRRAAYFCNLKIAEYNDTLLPVQDFVIRVTHPKHYTLKKSNNQECGRHFYFGGPGPQRSTAARVTSSMFSLFIVMIMCVLMFLCAY